MQRGDVYWVDFEPARGAEMQMRWPAVIVSNDAAIRQQNRVQVVPLTSKVTRVYRWEALVQLDGRPHKALADQLRTVAKERLSDYTGGLSPADLLAVERAIGVHLGLP
ncbi:MAG: type II toxin-antitoxin system PemK/MazF family toxin [Dehalococcoidia bacterium]